MKTGIINRASEAKEQTEAAQTEEQTALSTYEDYIYEYTSEIEVEQVTDTNPGTLEGSGTETEPYVINSIEDLVFFAHEVTNGNTYEGEYVSLGLNLDFNSTKSYVNAYRTDYGTYGYDGELKTLLTTGEGFKSIGTENGNTEKNFYGIFEGNNYTISSLYVNRNINAEESFQSFGLFATNYGTIINLNINASLNLKSYKNNILIGIIAGLNYGTIENCSSTGYISIEGYQENGYIAAGGISGQSQKTGIIKKCNNSCKIYGNAKTLYIGGIVGSNNNNVLNSYNTGSLQINGNSEIYDIRCRRYNRVYWNRKYRILF